MSATTGNQSSVRSTTGETESKGTDDLAFVCHPSQRGGVTRWMVDAAVEWQRRTGSGVAAIYLPSPAFPRYYAMPSLLGVGLFLGLAVHTATAAAPVTKIVIADVLPPMLLGLGSLLR